MSMRGPLNGLRVVDFGDYIAGPLTALMLADQGAEVIHVDRPGGPALTGARDAVLNRSKRRVTLDLKRDGDLAEAKRLVSAADVVIENFRPGVLDRLGLGIESLRADNSRLITCSLPGFAKDDPRAKLRAYEGILDAATSNWQPRNGEEPEGWDWERPFYSAIPFASQFGGYLAATAVVMAAIARRRTGRGQHVEVPLFDAMFQLVGHSGAYVKERGVHLPNPIRGRGSGPFRCADGRYVQFDTSSARHLRWFASTAGVAAEWEPELLDLTANARPEMNERLTKRLSELFLTKTAAEWEEIGNRAGAAIGFIRTPGEWIETDQAKATRAVTQVDDPEIGPMWMVGLPVGLEEFPDGEFAPRQLPGSSAPLSWEQDGPAPAIAEGSDPEITSPLQGYRVLDIGVALAGPTCGRMLGEFGADVLKIAAPHAGVGGYLNRGKDSILLDLGTVAGQDIYFRLVDTADVVLENLSPGTSQRLGIGRDYVVARRPQAVYTSISCYGHGGPWTSHRGWERQGQAVTGIMERTDLPSVLGPYNVADIGTGILGTFATGLALYHRQETGRGQLATASLAQTCTYHQTIFTFAYPGYTPTEPRGYFALGENALDRYYQASDRWLFLSARTEDLPALEQVTGTSDLLSASDGERASALEAAFAKTQAAEVISRLVEAGVAAHLAVNMDELMTDPDVVRRGLSISQDIPGVGTCIMPGLSQHLSDTPMRIPGPPHQPGSDAAAVLDSIGMGDKLEALERRWVVQTHDLGATWS